MRSILIAALLLAVAPFASAQHAGASGAALPATTAPSQARQFDFMIGLFEVTLTPKVNGLAAMIHGTPHLAGTWKGWRALDGFGIDDELRIVDGSGNPRSLSHAMRVWSQTESRWNITTADAYRGRVSIGSGQMADAEMRTNGQGVDGEGKAYLSRNRFFAIGPDGFKMEQDRSYDDGKTWEEAVIAIEAKRSAPTAAR